MARMAALDIRACGWVFVVVVLRLGLHFRGHDDESDLREWKLIEQLRREKVVSAVELLTAARMTGTLAGSSTVHFKRISIPIGFVLLKIRTSTVEYLCMEIS